MRPKLGLIGITGLGLILDSRQPIRVKVIILILLVLRLEAAFTAIETNEMLA